MFRWLTAGESHGPQHTVILDGESSRLSLKREREDPSGRVLDTASLA